MKQPVSIELMVNIEAKSLEEAIQHAMNTILDESVDIVITRMAGKYTIFVGRMDEINADRKSTTSS